MMKVLEDVFSRAMESSFTPHEGRDLENIYDFELDFYASTCAENAQLNPNAELAPCDIRPYGKWYEHWFGDTADIHIVSYNMIFAAGRENIQRRPHEFYNEIIQQVSTEKDSECAHYFERCLHRLFNL